MTMDEKEKQVNTKAKDKVRIPKEIIIKDFAEALGVPIAEMMAELMKNGIMSSMNERIDFETASIIAEDLEKEVELLPDEEVEKGKDEKTQEQLAVLLEEKGKNLRARPPVVVVMGHVDHGKTKLLDAIRKTNVVEGEAGGITQSIGAYQVTEKGKEITFIDTPGHEAFTAMRSRGANVADIAILVVAADDGIQTQTKEALEIIQRAELPFMVALNKIDKPEANQEKVKKELSDLNLIPEEWGGKTICASISAKKLIGIKELLDMVLLLAEMEEENLKANPSRDAVGTVIESHVSKEMGPLATVIIQTGTLKIGDLVSVGDVGGRIKSLENYKGEKTKQAPPSMPVRILGLKDAPVVGDILQVSRDRAILKQKIKKYRSETLIQPGLSRPQKKEGEEEDQKEVKYLNIHLKTNTLGSQEAILASLDKLKHPEVAVRVTDKRLGNITEQDILQAESTKSYLIGFDVSVSAQAQDVLKDRRLTVKTFTIIYELLNYVKKELEDSLEPEIIETPLGKIKILAIFKTDAGSQIIGGRVMDGKIQNDSHARVIRGDKAVGIGQIVQLQSEKKNVPEVLKDSECGMKLESNHAVEVNDVLEIFIKEEKKRTL